MSESQSDRFFSVLEHAIVPIRATEFGKVYVECGVAGPDAPLA